MTMTSQPFDASGSNNARDNLNELPAIEPKIVAVIARDFDDEDESDGGFDDDNMGFNPYFSEIIKVADKEDADLILFSLWSHDETKLGALSRSILFPRQTKHRFVVLEIVNNKEGEILVHERTKKSPIRIKQYFGRSADSKAKKIKFVSSLKDRTFGNSVIFVCGETNILNTKLKNNNISDDFNVIDYLKNNKIKFILNPVHDYMVRYEMTAKRLALSRAGNTLICVWNRGCKSGSEAKVPWAAYRDGEVITNKIRELERPIARQPGIRIGILKI